MSFLIVPRRKRYVRGLGFVATDDAPSAPVSSSGQVTNVNVHNGPKAADASGAAGAAGSVAQSGQSITGALTSAGGSEGGFMSTLTSPGAMIPVAVGGAAAAAGSILYHGPDSIDRARSSKTIERKTTSAVAGGAIGAAASGAAIGTMIAPGIGTVIGALLGAGAGAAGGLFSSQKLKKKNRKLRQQEAMEAMARAEEEKRQEAARLAAVRASDERAYALQRSVRDAGLLAAMVTRDVRQVQAQLSDPLMPAEAARAAEAQLAELESVIGEIASGVQALSGAVTEQEQVAALNEAASGAGALRAVSTRVLKLGNELEEVLRVQRAEELRYQQAVKLQQQLALQESMAADRLAEELQAASLDQARQARAAELRRQLELSMRVDEERRRLAAAQSAMESERRLALLRSQVFGGGLRGY